MTLSHFLNIMYLHLGNRKNIYDFVIELFDALIDPRIPNPLEKYEKNSIYKIFRGKFSFSKKIAGNIYHFISRDNFCDYLSNYSNLQIDNLIREFDKENILISRYDSFEDIFDIFSLIVKKIFEPTTKIVYNKKRLSLKDLPRNAYYKNNTLYINNKEIKFEDIDESKYGDRYIKQLLQLYSFTTKKTINDISDIDKLPKRLLNDFTIQKKSFVNIITLKYNICKIFNDGAEEFKILETEIFDYIQSVIADSYDSPYKSFLDTTKKAMDCNINKSLISNIKGLIGNNEKRGIVHLLVNENLIESWIIDEN